MIQIDEYIERQIAFDNWLDENRGKLKKLEAKTDKFLHIFTLERLQKLNIDEYIVGKQSKDSFCWWLETGLIELGRIKGGTTAGNKFGIYFGRTKSDKTTKYRYPQKYARLFGNSPEEVFSGIRTNLIALIKAGSNSDNVAIRKIPLSPMFKGKILATYFPSKYLNIFSKEHLQYYHQVLGISYLSGDDELTLRNNLLHFKNKSELAKNWSVFEFGVFLYTYYTPPSNHEARGEQNVNKEVLLPAVDKVNIQGKTSILDIVDEQNAAKAKKEDYKPNYLLTAQRNKRIGDRGEEIVVEYEKQKLRSVGKQDLAEKIDRVSIRTDSVGYDIVSFNADGSEKFIEVKSSLGPVSDPDFHLSDNQLRVAKEKGTNYWLYFVFDTESKTSNIREVNNPFINNSDRYLLSPTMYRVKLKFITGEPDENKT